METIAPSTTTWKLDPAHSTVEFSVRHMMITTVKGGFGGVEGSVTVDGEDTSNSGVEVEIDAASIDTRTEQRDDHLRSGDFLDVENHPFITFRSTGVKGSFADPGDSSTVTGELTIRGTTKPVELDVTYQGDGIDPWGGERKSFSARATIDRRDFGLTWNQTLESGGILVGHDIKLAVEAQFVKEG